MKAKEVPVGEVYGRLTVVGEAERAANGQRQWRCRCQCGNEKVARPGNLRAGRTRSCGCLYKESMASFYKTNTSHGESKYASAEYRAWRTIKHNCRNACGAHYRYYGGRGVTVCQRWSESFTSFLADVGRRPSPKHQFMLIDFHGDYEPGNTKWALPREVRRNGPCNHNVIANGRCQPISAWAEETGLSEQTIAARIKHGWIEEDAVTLPVGEHRLARKVPVNEMSDAGS